MFIYVIYVYRRLEATESSLVHTGPYFVDASYVVGTNHSSWVQVVVDLWVSPNMERNAGFSSAPCYDG